MKQADSFITVVRWPPKSNWMRYSVFALVLYFFALVISADEAEPFNILNQRKERLLSGGLLGFTEADESPEILELASSPPASEQNDNQELSDKEGTDAKYGDYGGYGCNRCGDDPSPDCGCCPPQTTTTTLTLTWSTTQTSFETSFVFLSTTLTSTITFTSSIPGPTFYFTYSFTSLTTLSSTVTSTTTSSTTTSTTTTSTVTLSTSTLQTITIY